MKSYLIVFSIILILMTSYIVFSQEQLTEGEGVASSPQAGGGTGGPASGPPATGANTNSNPSPSLGSVGSSGSEGGWDVTGSSVGCTTPGPVVQSGRFCSMTFSGCPGSGSEPRDHDPGDPRPSPEPPPGGSPLFDKDD